MSCTAWAHRLDTSPKFRDVRYAVGEFIQDAWERLKSLADPSDKRRFAKIILDGTATEPSLRERLQTEAKELTSIGNSHLIRHSEVNQVPVIDVSQVDYLFHRLFTMVQLVLKKK